MSWHRNGKEHRCANATCIDAARELVRPGGKRLATLEGDRNEMADVEEYFEKVFGESAQAAASETVRLLEPGGGHGAR